MGLGQVEFAPFFFLLSVIMKPATIRVMITIRSTTTITGAAYVATFHVSVWTYYNNYDICLLPWIAVCEYGGILWLFEVGTDTLESSDSVITIIIIL